MHILVVATSGSDEQPVQCPVTFSIANVLHCLPFSFPLYYCLQYHILRNKGTEAAGTGEYNKLYDDGTYKCGGCGTPLYKYAFTTRVSCVLAPCVDSYCCFFVVVQSLSQPDAGVSVHTLTLVDFVVDQSTSLTLDVAGLHTMTTLREQ